MKTEPGYYLYRKLSEDSPWLSIGFMQDEHAATSAALRYAAVTGHHTKVENERGTLIYDSVRDGTDEPSIAPSAVTVET